MSAPLIDPLLIDLLRRAHRPELLPLADALALDPRGLDRSALAVAIDVNLRRRAANHLENLVRRRGRGPDYMTVLRRLCRRQGLSSAGPVDDLEQRLLDAHERRLPAPTPPEPLEPRPRSLLRQLGTRLVRLFERPPAPIPGPLLLTWLFRPDPDRVLRAVVEVARLRQQIRDRVTVGVVGSPSAGKDAAIAALFGVHTGNVSPVAGSTRAVEILPVPDRSSRGEPALLYVINTPGLGDLVESVSDEARRIVDHVDVFLYVVNAQGGVQEREKSDYDALVATERPVLAVVNKIDTILEADRARYLDDARQKLGAPESAFLAAAFDPLPGLAERPLGVDDVRAWLLRTVPHLKRLPPPAPRP